MKKQNLHAWTDRAAGKIAGVLLALQTKFAKLMHKTVADWPVRKLKVSLIIFCILAGGFSIYFAAVAVFRADRQPAYTIDKMNAPKHIDKTGDEIITPAVDEDVYREIQAFKKSSYYDSIVRSRPGLTDSIKMLEEIYEAQKIR